MWSMRNWPLVSLCKKKKELIYYSEYSDLAAYKYLKKYNWSIKENGTWNLLLLRWEQGFEHLSPLKDAGD